MERSKEERKPVPILQVVYCRKEGRYVKLENCFLCGYSRFDGKRRLYCHGPSKAE